MLKRFFTKSTTSSVVLSDKICSLNDAASSLESLLNCVLAGRIDVALIENSSNPNQVGAGLRFHLLPSHRTCQPIYLLYALLQSQAL